MESEVKKKAQELYPNLLFGESFNDGHVGGCNVNGDAATHYPVMWKYLVELFEIKSVIDVGCGFGYSLDYFKKYLKLDAIGVEGSSKVKSLALNQSSIYNHDYCTGPLTFEKEYDLCWSSEFVEHVEEKFIENFMTTFCCCRYAAITYAGIGQGGYHHVNTNTNEYWVKTFANYGLAYDEEVTLQLRKKTEEDRQKPTSPVDQSIIENWNWPYHFSERGLFFKNTHI